MYEKVERRNLCPATYLATLFTGQEAVCPALAAPFLRYNCRFLRVRARARAQPGRSFFAGLLSPVARNSRGRILPRGPQSGSRVRSRVRPFFYHAALLFCAVPLLPLRSSRRSYASPSMSPIFTFPPAELRSEKVQALLDIFNRSFLPNRSPFRVAEKATVVAIRSPVNNVRHRDRYNYF